MAGKISEDADAGALAGTELIPVVSGGDNKTTTPDALATRHAAGGAVKTALDLKAPLASPTFTGTPAAPTAAGGTNTTQVATTAFVRTEITSLINSAPGALDTLDELAAALGDDANFASTVTTALAGKQPIDSDLTDIAALSPSNDDFIQRKGGVWTKRTVAEVTADLLGGAWSTWTSTISTTVAAGSGFTTSPSPVIGAYRKNGRTVHWNIQFTLTNLGSGPAASGTLQMTLPFTAAAASICVGCENAVTGNMIYGNVSAGSNILQLKSYNNGALVVVNYQIRASGTYEADS